MTANANKQKSQSRDNESRASESRTAESREAEGRKFAPYKPQAVLGGVPAREGYTRQWIAVKIGDEEQDVSEYFENQGWVPVKASDYPNLTVPTMEFGGFGNCIKSGGMILCEIPTERAVEIGAYWENRASVATDAIMAEADDKIDDLRKLSTKIGTSVGGKALNNLPNAALQEAA